MRKYIVRKSEYGTMPSAGFAQKLMKMVSDYDGWQAIMFLKDFFDRETPLETEDGELFFCYRPSNEFLDLDYRFFDNEDAMIDWHRYGDRLKYFRFFSLKNEFGLEEIQVL